MDTVVCASLHLPMELPVGVVTTRDDSRKWHELFNGLNVKRTPVIKYYHFVTTC